MRIVRKKIAASGLRMCKLLSVLGVPYNTSKGFWISNAGNLHLLYHDAHVAYLKAIKHSHPDKGGSASETRELNRAWRLIKSRIKEKIDI